MNCRSSPIVLSDQDRQVDVSGFALTETYRPPGLILPPHCHEHANIALAVDGSFIETVGPKPYEVYPYSVIFRPAGEKHSNRYGKTAAHCLIIEVRPQRLAELRQVTDVLERASYVQPGLFAHSVLAMSRELRIWDSAASLAIESLILEILVQATRGSQRNDRKPPKWLRQAREIVHEQFKQSLSLSTIAELVGIHAAHLAKMFRQHYGYTIGDYIRRRRLDYASQLLVRSECSLSAIALAAGFYDQSHFARLFKLRFGIAPGVFRAGLRTRYVPILEKQKELPSN